MVEQTDLPILFGVSHSKKENAGILIRALKSKGLKSGDTLGIEGFSRHELSTPADIARIIRYLKDDVAKEKKRLNEMKHTYKLTQNATDKMEVLSEFHGEESRQNRTEFNLTLLEFCQASKINLVGIGTFLKNKQFKQQVRSFVIGPVREKIWVKSIAITKPKFIAFGAGHMSAIRKQVPHKEAVLLSALPTVSRIPIEGKIQIDTIERARRKYAVRNKVRKVKRFFRSAIFSRKKKA